MLGIRYAWYSRKQEAVCGGHLIYRLVDGTPARVTELTLRKEPFSSWDDLVYLGEVNLDTSPCLQSKMQLPITQTLKNFKKIDPEKFKQYYEPLMDRLEKFENKLHRVHHCDRAVYKVGKCTCGTCDSPWFSRN